MSGCWEAVYLRAQRDMELHLRAERDMELVGTMVLALQSRIYIYIYIYQNPNGIKINI